MRSWSSMSMPWPARVCLSIWYLLIGYYNSGFKITPGIPACSASESVLFIHDSRILGLMWFSFANFLSLSFFFGIAWSSGGEIDLRIYWFTDWCRRLNELLSICNSVLLFYLNLYETRDISKKPLNGMPLTDYGCYISIAGNLLKIYALSHV